MNPSTPENNTSATAAMATHRIGKIARLPVEIRQELNERLADNEPGERILRWLNRQPEVKEVLADLFDGRPISQQNLSAWKLGGFRDWERHQRTRALARDFLDEAEELAEEVWEEEEDGRRSLLDRVSDRMALALLQLFREAEESEPGPSRARAMLEITKEVARLRRGDHVRQRTTLLQERWEAEQETARQKVREECMAEHEKTKKVAFAYGHAFYWEYIQGLATETLSPERKAHLEWYFAHNAKALTGAGWSLPTGEALKQAVAKERERTKTRKKKNESDGPQIPKSAMKQPEMSVPESGAMAKSTCETSLHKAPQGETSRENFADGFTNTGEV